MAWLDASDDEPFLSALGFGGEGDMASDGSWDGGVGGARAAPKRRSKASSQQQDAAGAVLLEELRLSVQDAVVPLRFSLQLLNSLADAQPAAAGRAVASAVEAAVRAGLQELWQGLGRPSPMPLRDVVLAGVAHGRGVQTWSVFALMPGSAAQAVQERLLQGVGGLSVQVPGARCAVLAHVHVPTATGGVPEPAVLFTLSTSLAGLGAPKALLAVLRHDPARFGGMQVHWVGQVSCDGTRLVGRVGVGGVVLPDCEAPPGALPGAQLGLGVGGQRALQGSVTLAYCASDPVVFSLRRVPNRARPGPPLPSWVCPCQGGPPAPPHAGVPAPAGAGAAGPSQPPQDGLVVGSGVRVSTGRRRAAAAGGRGRGAAVAQGQRDGGQGVGMVGAVPDPEPARGRRGTRGRGIGRRGGGRRAASTPRGRSRVRTAAAGASVPSGAGGGAPVVMDGELAAGAGGQGQGAGTGGLGVRGASFADVLRRAALAPPLTAGPEAMDATVLGARRPRSAGPARVAQRRPKPPGTARAAGRASQSSGSYGLSPGASDADCDGQYVRRLEGRA